MTTANSKICKFCGATFQPTPERFCSQKCGRAAISAIANKYDAIFKREKAETIARKNAERKRDLAEKSAKLRAWLEDNGLVTEEIYNRKCHDCGKPTKDYRCPKCWKTKWKKQGITPKQANEIRASSYA